MKSLWKKKVADPLLGFLKQGITPSKLSWALTVGALIAVFPVFGSATILSVLAIYLFRLNPAAVLISGQLAYPLQFVLYIPFIRMGAWLFNIPDFDLSISYVFGLFTADFLNAVKVLWTATWRAIVAWLITGLPASVLLYLLFRFIFRRLALTPDADVI